MMRVNYDPKKKTISYIGEDVQAPPPAQNQERPSNKKLFDYMKYMNTSINNQFSYIYSNMNIPPYQV